MAQPFDTKAMRLTGDPIPIVQQIGTGPSHAHFSVTAGGVMAYRTGPGNKYQLTWVDRTGKTLETIGEPALEGPGEPGPSGISLSPDEKQLAIVRFDAASGGSNIWLLDIARNIETRLTTGQNVLARDLYGYGAVWSPDGKSLAYSAGDGIYVKDTGGAADAKLVKNLGHPVLVTDWTRDGKFLIYDDGKDIREISVQGGEPAPVVTGDMEDIRGRISPDSRWVAYDSARSGRREVYIRPYAVPGAGTAPAGPVIQISRDGGGAARWSADGTEVFFLTINGSLMAAKIERSNGGFRPEAPAQTGIRLPSAVWAAGRSSQRFLVDAPLDRGIETPITVVTNWEGSLKQQR